MDKIWAERWVKALRSGEYAQTSHALNRTTVTPGCDEGCCPAKPTGFCCLGVLADLVIKEDPTAGRWTENGTLRCGDEVSMSFLTHPIVEIVGTNGGDPILFRDENSDGRSIAVTASEANDSRKMSFAEIADKIEQNYETM